MDETEVTRNETKGKQKQYSELVPQEKKKKFLP